MKAKDIRKGTILMFRDAPHRVMDFQHRTPGNLRAFVQVTLRNALNGIQSDHRFSATEDIQPADIFAFPATYMYKDDLGFHFMNSKNYEEIVITEELAGDAALYLQDGTVVDIATFQDQPIGLSLPKTVTLEIVDTSPELRGATASNSPKPATTETGLKLNVPPFLKNGDKIIVDTATGDYISRAD